MSCESMTEHLSYAKQSIILQNEFNQFIRTIMTGHIIGILQNMGFIKWYLKNAFLM